MLLVCHAVLSVHCSLVGCCWEKAILLALLYVMFSCVTFPSDVLGQVWFLIVSIPDRCLLSDFDSTSVLEGLPGKVSKGAKIRNQYNQVPHLTLDTNGKVTNSQLDTTNESQEVSPFNLVSKDT